VEQERCPGYIGKDVKIELHLCPNCRYVVEIFTDEVKRKCPKCGVEVYRERTPSCIDWCKYAKQCLGVEKWKELLEDIKKREEK